MFSFTDIQPTKNRICYSRTSFQETKDKFLFYLVYNTFLLNICKTIIQEVTGIPTVIQKLQVKVILISFILNFEYV